MVGSLLRWASLGRWRREILATGNANEVATWRWEAELWRGALGGCSSLTGVLEISDEIHPLRIERRHKSAHLPDAAIATSANAMLATAVALFVNCLLDLCIFNVILPLSLLNAPTAASLSESGLQFFLAPSTTAQRKIEARLLGP